MLLAKIIRTLSEEEIDRVRREFKLTARPRMLFERIVKSPGSPPKSKEVCKELKITEENLYRIYSEITSECIRILAPKHEFPVLEFYRSKYLYQPFITELRRAEKQIVKTKNNSLLERFYEYAFYNSSQFPASIMDLDITHEFGEKWHKFKTNPPPDDDLYIIARVIYMRISSLPSRKKMTLTQMSAKAQSLLATIRKRAQRSPNPLARCVYYQSEWKSCIFDHKDIHKGIYWLRRCLEVVQEYKEKFSPDVEEYTELEIANELAINWGKATEGLEIYRKYYRGQTPETPNGALFLLRYIKVAFLAREYDLARKIVSQVETHQIVRSSRELQNIFIIMYAKLELALGCLDKARDDIDLARKGLKEKFFLAYELQVRGLETTLLLKQGNFVTAEKLVRRHIKWLHLRRFSLEQSSWIHYYNMIGAIIQFKMTKAPIRRALLQHFMNDFRTENPEFYMLLEPEITEATAKKRKRR